ncbi:MarR family transcriptional regulator [Paraburkholderia sp. RL17-383-BIF-A]|uniref:MarR family winged helix-turn-helix transcriptional regulator n=1 Tax=Paraburkholderia sp. RL17-383-BIF-A TaxID=3031631 RepID=UPI0038B71CCD
MSAYPSLVADEKIHLCNLICRARAVLWDAATQRTLSTLGLTTSQAAILLAIAIARECSAAELARELGIDASAVTRLVDRLGKVGLVVRRRIPTDRRVLLLWLSAEGERAAAQIPAIFTETLKGLLLSFTVEEIDLFKGMLGKILVNAGQQIAPPLVTR